MTHSTPSGRVFALDNLRAALVMLVIVHHAALVYSAFAPFYYQEPPYSDPLAFLLLGVFALINQAWFMSTLFFIAGYFTPYSYDNKGVRDYLLGRLLRLGLPLIVGIIVLEPLAQIGFFLMPRELTGITGELSFAAWPRMLGLGPLWFIALALVFSVGYALWRLASRGQMPLVRRPAPPLLHVCVFIAILAAITWVWRMAVPLGRDVSVFTDALSFPTLSYLPHYLAFFVIGVATRRNGWLQAPTRAGIWQGAVPALVATIVLLPWALSGNFLQLTFSPGAEFTGNGTWQSGLFSIWDSIMAVGLLVAALGLFESWFNREGPVWRFLARQSYAAFLIHVIVVTFVAYGLHGLDWPALAKFVLLAVIAVPLSFGIAYVIRLIPGVSKVV